MAEFPKHFPFVGGTGKVEGSSSSEKPKVNFPASSSADKAPKKVANITGLFIKTLGLTPVQYNIEDLKNAPPIYQKMASSFANLKEGNQGSIIGNMKVLAAYRENLPAAIAGFQKNQILTSNDLNAIQGKLHTSTGSHLSRLDKPTPEKVGNYINGLLSQVEGHYERAARENKLEAFFQGLNTGGCFEEIVQGVDESMEAAYSSNSLQDPLLPNTFNLELAQSSEVVHAYYSKFLESKMSEIHHGSDSDKLQLLEKQGALSKAEFKKFLAGTNFKNIACQSGKLTEQSVNKYYEEYL